MTILDVCLNNPMDELQARQLNPVSLAFAGDSVYDLYVRARLLRDMGCNSHKLHCMAVRYVSARGQAAGFERIKDMLSEDEIYIFKRGRNANPATVPKNADISDYRTATGLEAMLGYLFLTGQTERVGRLMQVILDNNGEHSLKLSAGESSGSGGLEN